MSVTLCAKGTEKRLDERALCAKQTEKILDECVSLCKTDGEDTR